MNVLAGEACSVAHDGGHIVWSLLNVCLADASALSFRFNS
jgi:hypothetical protein